LCAEAQHQPVAAAMGVGAHVAQGSCGQPGFLCDLAAGGILGGFAGLDVSGHQHLHLRAAAFPLEKHLAGSVHHRSDDAG